MADVAETYLREQLQTRRQRLESVVAVTRPPEDLVQLLSQVDAALSRMDQGTYGICETCHEPVEKDRLLVDPLICFCLDHLTADQRRALEQDLELATRVQRELLPKPDLRFAGWEASYHYQPLGAVSGDYCDLVVHQNATRGFFFALGDVSGKGVAASMLMSQLHAIFRTLLALDLPVESLVERAGRVFCESTMSSLFATLVCGLARASGEVEVCNAGHCPALLFQKGVVREIAATGVPLGMFSEGWYPAQKTAMLPGDVLLLYTDGVSEARSTNHEEYGETRLASVLGQAHEAPLPGLIQACLRDLADFRSGAPLLDDLTLLAIRRTTPA